MMMADHQNKEECLITEGERWIMVQYEEQATRMYEDQNQPVKRQDQGMDQLQMDDGVGESGLALDLVHDPLPCIHQELGSVCDSTGEYTLNGYDKICIQSCDMVLAHCQSWKH